MLITEYALLAVPFLALAIVAWKALDVLLRSQSFTHDRDRDKLIHLVEKLVEKRDVPQEHKLPLAQLHAEERVGEVRANTAMQNEATRANGPVLPMPEEESVYESLHG